MYTKIILLVTHFLFVFTIHAQQLKLVLPIGHTKSINTSEYSTDGKYIVTASGDKTAKIWNAVTGDLLLDLKGHKEEVRTAKFSPDGKYIVTTSNDWTARVWEVTEGKCLMELRHKDIVSSASYSPDGRSIATGCWDDSVRIWDIATAKTKITINTWDNVKSIEFSPDGKKILTNNGSYFSPYIEIFDVENGKPIVRLPNKFINTVRFSTDGEKLITTSREEALKIWNAADGKLIKEFEQYKDVNDALYSPDGKNILILDKKDSARILDAIDGHQLIKLKTKVYFVNYSSDGRYILCHTGDNATKSFSTVSGELIKKYSGHTYGIYGAFFSPDNKYILTTAGNGTRLWNRNGGPPLNNNISIAGEFSPDSKYVVSVYRTTDASFLHDSTFICVKDAFSGEVISKFIEETEEEKMQRRRTGFGSVNSLKFSPDGKNILSTSDRGYIKLWDLTQGKKIKEIKVEGNPVSATFTADGKYIVALSKAGINSKLTRWGPAGNYIDETNWITNVLEQALLTKDYKNVLTLHILDTLVTMWGYDNHDIKFTLSGHTNNVNSIAFSPDGKYILTASDDKTAKTWDIETGKMILDLKGHTDGVKRAQSSPDGKLILTSSNDNTNKVWDTKTGALLYTFFSLDNNDYFFQLPEGYYYCTPAAAKLLHYVKGRNVISFDQLDIKYNRPDKVLEAIGNPDTALIKAYRKAYFKRIKKLGIDTVSFREGYSVPEADFTNRDAIKYEQRENKLILNIHGSDSLYILDRYNVWVNEVPVYGSKGISIRKNKSNSLDITVTVTLSNGENRIETSVINANGAESYRIPLRVKYIPEKAGAEKIYFIGIGINNFKDKKYNLQWSVKDIRDLAIKFKQKTNGEISIDTLFNENVTVKNIKKLKEKLLQTSVDDKVIIAYSGHGLLSKEYDYYLSTYNINFNGPEKDGLPYEELEGLLDNIPARKKLMLIDACHSGEVDKEELTAMVRVQKQLDPDKKGANEIIDTTVKTLGSRNTIELMHELFANVGKSTGATIISAAAGTQFALESGDLENGVFTFSILESMKQTSTMAVKQLKQIIGARVEQLTNGQQKPTSRNETLEYDWSIW